MHIPLRGALAPLTMPGKPPSTLLNGLVSYWKLDEASGLRADSTGTNDLTDNAGVTQAVGKIGNAGQFTAASNNFLSHANNSSLQIGATSFTITCWVFLDDLAADHGLVSRWDTVAGQLEYTLEYNAAGGNRFKANLSTTGSNFPSVVADAFGAPSLSTWYFLLLSFDLPTTTVKIQVNNGAANTSNLGASIFAANQVFRIGRRNAGGQNHSGRIDEVGFWKRILTASELAALYNGGSGLTYPFS